MGEGSDHSLKIRLETRHSQKQLKTNKSKFIEKTEKSCKSDNPFCGKSKQRGMGFVMTPIAWEEDEEERKWGILKVWIKKGFLRIRRIRIST